MPPKLNPERIRDWIDLSGLLIDVAGVIVVLTGAVVATVIYLVGVGRGSSSLITYRKNIGRSILLGLEFSSAGISSGQFRLRTRNF